MSAEAPTIVIEPAKTNTRAWLELWTYRELLFFFAWRDIKIRYKQAVLGIAWVVVQPLVQTILLTFVFSKVAGMQSGGLPYPVLVLAGLIPWQLFSAAFSGAGSSMTGNSHLITKVYFPRLIIPLSSLLVAVIDMVVLQVLALPFVLWHGVMPTWHLLVMPAFVLLTLFIAFGAGLWISTLSTKYRDFRIISPFLLQIGLFVTPVGFRSDTLRDYGDLVALNPLTGVVEGFRWCLLGGQSSINVGSLVCSLVGGTLLVLTGLWYFKAAERQFSDYI